MAKAPTVKKSSGGTIVVDNFQGSMSSYLYGDINSGMTNVVTVSGQDPFTKPGVLTWMESATQIDPNATVITDCIMAGKARVEGGIVYVYAIGHLGRLYKIQVNDTASHNPNYDNPVLLATLTAQTPTFTRGAFIDFFGATQRIYIGHDVGVTMIDFTGSNELFIGSAGSWTQLVPRPLKQFVGNLYAGNGSNLAEIIDPSTVSTYAKISPGFPANTQVRDLEITPEGTYLTSIITDLALVDITTSAANTSNLAPSLSYMMKWNGSDKAITSLNIYPAVSLTANSTFGTSQYVFGYDFMGGAVYNPTDKWLTSTTTSAFAESPMPNAVVSAGNLLMWMTPLLFNGVLNLILCVYGTISGYEIKKGYWDLLFQGSSGTETDINRVPCMIPVSNFAQGSSFDGYTNFNFGNSKIYFSTVESSSTPTTKYKFYQWTPAPTGLGTPQVGAIYETQRQAFSKKITVSNVRVYGEPWVAGNSFIIDLIGSSGNPITNGSFTFTAGTNMGIGDDFAWYGPDIAPTYALGVRVTQNGTVNHTINKIEIDWSESGV